jgi:thioredoxin 1
LLIVSFCRVGSLLTRLFFRTGRYGKVFKKSHLTSLALQVKLAASGTILLRKGAKMAENVIELTDATFDKIVTESDEPVLVDFWAPWCGPCKMVAPIIAEIAGEFEGRVTVAKVDTDEHREAAVEYAINAIPTIILFHNGKIEKKWVGLTSKKDIRAELEQLV